MGTQLKYLCGKGDTTVSLAAVRHNWKNLYWCVSVQTGYFAGGCSDDNKCERRATRIIKSFK